MENTVSVDQEVAMVSMQRPHVVLLGAGASKAALPAGDKHGKTVPLLRDLARDLELSRDFPYDLQVLAETDFEAAYSELADTGNVTLTNILDRQVRQYFSQLELPDHPTLYDTLLLSLRRKDAIFTFNWDPFLLQAARRLTELGLRWCLPRLHFLHGNVTLGFCEADQRRGIIGTRCPTCDELFAPTPLLYPIQVKNYYDGSLIEREWTSVKVFLKSCFMLTIFGYSAPQTDVEAIRILRGGWGDPAERSMEQTEIITRPEFDDAQIRKRWRSFIHSHHYEVHGSFYNSWISNHPRRTGEAYLNQYFEAMFIDDNPVPPAFPDFEALKSWFEPLLAIERTNAQ